MSDTDHTPRPLTRQEQQRVAQLAGLLETNPRPEFAELANLWGVSKQRAHQILRSLVRKGAVADRGYEIPRTAIDTVNDDKTEKSEHPISQDPVTRILETEYRRHGLTGRTEGNRVIVTRTLTASLPLGPVAQGVAIHRCARALARVEVPRP